LKGEGWLTIEGQEHRWLILEIIPNTRKIDQGRDAEARQQISRTDARELQDLGAMNGPSSENNLTACTDRVNGIAIS